MGVRAPRSGNGAALAIAAVGAWAIVVSRCYAPPHGAWLSFACGVAFAGLGAAGLILREARLRVVLGELASSAQPQTVARLIGHDGAWR